MNRLSLLECIEAITLGDMSFNTLKNVVIDGNAKTYDYVWCYKSYAIFKVKIDNVPHIMKIYLKNDSDQLYKTFDRCNTFYSNIFIKMEVLYDELNVFLDNKLQKHDVSIILADFDKKIDNKYEYSRKFARLTVNILNTKFIIDNFSLMWCVNSGGELKISLERGGTVMSYKEIQTDMLIAFKNYLLSVVSYIRYNYSEDNFDKFIENSPEFKISDYKRYNSPSFIKLLTPAVGNTELNESIYSLLNDSSRDSCAKTLESMMTNLEEWWSNSTDNNNRKTALDLLMEKYEIIGEENENMISVKDKESGKYGFINEDCNIVIECIYDTASDFVEGVCIASIDSKFGVINNDGEILIDFKYEDLEWCVEYNIFITQDGQLNGLITRTGKIILEPTHMWIDLFYCSRARYQDFRTSKIGYINPEGEIVIEAQWDDASSFENGYAKVKVANHYYDIDIDGKRIF